jgi:hypothetical protein
MAILPMNTLPMHCPQCRTENPAAASFCKHCGVALQSKAEAVTTLKTLFRRFRIPILAIGAVGVLLLFLIIVIAIAGSGSQPQAPVDPQVTESTGFNIGPVGIHHDYTGPSSQNPMHQPSPRQ